MKNDKSNWHISYCYDCRLKTNVRQDIWQSLGPICDTCVDKAIDRHKEQSSRNEELSMRIGLYPATSEQLSLANRFLSFFAANKIEFGASTTLPTWSLNCTAHCLQRWIDNHKESARWARETGKDMFEHRLLGWDMGVKCFVNDREVNFYEWTEAGFRASREAGRRAFKNKSQRAACRQALYEYLVRAANEAEARGDKDVADSCRSVANRFYREYYEG